MHINITCIPARHADILYNSAVIFKLHLEFNLYGNCERSKLSGEFNGTDFLYTCIYIIYVSGRTSCHKCSKCFYVYLKISDQCDIPQCNYKCATRKRNRLNDLAYKSVAVYVEHSFARFFIASEELSGVFNGMDFLYISGSPYVVP